MSSIPSSLLLFFLHNPYLVSIPSSQFVTLKKDPSVITSLIFFLFFLSLFCSSSSKPLSSLPSHTHHISLSSHYFIFSPSSLFFSLLFLTLTQYKCTEAVKKFIADGADVNEKDCFSGYTALHWAADNKQVEVVKALLEAGAKVNEPNGSGDTPLHVCALFGHKELAEFLLTKGADLAAKNETGQTPYAVAKDQKKKVVAKLLKDEEKKRKKAAK